MYMPRRGTVRSLQDQHSDAARGVVAAEERRAERDGKSLRRRASRHQSAQPASQRSIEDIDAPLLTRGLPSVMDTSSG